MANEPSIEQLKVFFENANSFLFNMEFRVNLNFKVNFKRKFNRLHYYVEKTSP